MILVNALGNIFCRLVDQLPSYKKRKKEYPWFSRELLIWQRCYHPRDTFKKGEEVRKGVGGSILFNYLVYFLQKSSKVIQKSFWHDWDIIQTDGSHEEDQWLGPQDPQISPRSKFLSLWGHFKDKVYATSVANRDEVIQRIEAATATIDEEMQSKQFGKISFGEQWLAYKIMVKTSSICFVISPSHSFTFLCILQIKCHFHICQIIVNFGISSQHS